VEIIDELYSGIPALAAPAIRQDFATSYGVTATVLLVVPGVVSLLLEPLLFLLADRYPRRRFVLGGLAALALSALAIALAPGPALLAAAISVAWVATGVSVSLAQAELCDTHPNDRDRVMTRWALMGVIGDLAAPVLYAGLSALALGYRAAHVLVGALIAVHALALLRVPFPDAPREAEQEDESLWASLTVALRSRKLLVWLGACFLCELLDEILVVFASLRLRDELGAGPVVRSAAMAVCTLGGALGLFLSERLLARLSPLRVLALASCACTASYAGFLCTSSLGMAVLTLFLVGATATPLYPIAAAQAYAALPGRSGAVNAAGHLFTPLSLALPWLLGTLADRRGTTAALLVLLAQPVGLLLIALWQGRKARAQE
jgi:predicted MFS family arabinose efflux permease